MSLKKTPFFELRSGTVDLLHFVVKTPDLDELRAELGRRFESTPAFFAGESVAIDVRRLAATPALRIDRVEALLAEFRMRAAGVVVQPEQRGWAEAQGAPILESREKRERADSGDADADAASPAAAVPAAPAPVASVPEAPPPMVSTGSGPTLVIDRPLRSGQRIYAEGDLVVLGLVSYGAEVIAEGNIHIYAPLRGRALAGVHGNLGARIFCTCLEPELVSIAGIYRTTEHALAPDILGKSVQIRLENEKLIFEPLRLT
ncbi:MAG: septum site-determining protein MinC [Janthinobacterium lividum]